MKEPGPVSSGMDVVTLLKEQHRQVKAVFTRALSARGDQRKNTFRELTRLLTLHEAAEEEIVHPAARAALPDGDAVVEARLAEENEAKTTLRAMEALDVDSAEFESKLRALHFSVLAHADHEEREEFNQLARAIDANELERMTVRLRAAEERAEAQLNEKPRDSRVITDELR